MQLNRKPFRSNWKNDKEPERQHWRTPLGLFAELNRIFGFTIDACASHENALVKRYWDEADDCRQQDWSREVAWCNPPFKLAKFILPKAREARRAVFILPEMTLTSAYYRQTPADTICLPGYRIQFVPPLELPGLKPHANFGSVLLVYNPTPFQIAQLQRVDRWTIYADPSQAA